MRQHVIFAALIGAVALGTPGYTPAGPEYTIHTEDLAMVEIAEWATGRFEAAGLKVPTVEIHFHDSYDGCGGHWGTFNANTKRVNICKPERFVVLHELGHAWTRENLTDQMRAAYVAEGGFESWDGKDTVWSDRGSEDAADTIAWALLDEPISFWTEDGPIASRNAAFRLLTTLDSPRLVTTHSG